jgi:hypothetical protein
MPTVLSCAEPYAALHAYLSGRFADAIILTFAQIEDLIGCALPAAARIRVEWWSNEDQDGEPQRDAWRRASRTATPNLFARTVRFERDVVV